MIQLEFNEVIEINNKLYICSNCLKCKNECNIYCISKDSIIYCNKFNK